MSYETIVEKVKAVPLERLDEVENFLDSISPKNIDLSKVPEAKRPFFEAVGKISFDKDAVTRFREMSML